MEYVIQYHNIGDKPLDKYILQGFTVAEKLFNYLVPWMLNRKIELIEAQSIVLAARIGLTTPEFVTEFRMLKRMGKELRDKKDLERRYQEMLIEKRRCDRSIQKGLHVLEHKLLLIKRTQKHNTDRHGSKRSISLNIEEIDKLLSCFDLSFREFELGGVTINMTDNRGLMIVIKKMIKNRMFSRLASVKKKIMNYHEFVLKQLRVKKIQDIVSVKQYNSKVVQLIKEEIKGNPTGKEISMIMSWHYPYEDVKAAVLVAIQNKVKSIKYVNQVLKNDSIKRDSTYYDMFQVETPGAKYDVNSLDHYQND